MDSSADLVLDFIGLVMPASKRHFAPEHAQFITSSTYRPAEVFESDRFR
jgi:phosphoribosylanthranilate isomerase